MEKETKITVRIVNDENGHFIVKAVGYPGVVTFGRTQEEAMERVQEAWDAMAKFNAIKGKRNTTISDNWGSYSEIDYQLQFA